MVRQKKTTKKEEATFGCPSVLNKEEEDIDWYSKLPKHLIQDYKIGNYDEHLLTHPMNMLIVGYTGD